jgi:DNA-binding transcriptional MerR regulator
VDGISIGEAAERCGLSASALRYYEDARLIPPVERDGAGRRVFHEPDLAWVRYAVCLRSLGMGVAEIARYVDAAHGESGGAEQLALLTEHLERMRARRSELEHFIAVAEAKLRANGLPT